MSVLTVGEDSELHLGGARKLRFDKHKYGYAFSFDKLSLLHVLFSCFVS
jgi:hypothetical protein